MAESALKACPFVYEIPERNVMVHVLKSGVDVAPLASNPIGSPFFALRKSDSKIVLIPLSAVPATSAE